MSLPSALSSFFVGRGPAGPGERRGVARPALAHDSRPVRRVGPGGARAGGVRGDRAVAPARPGARRVRRGLGGCGSPRPARRVSPVGGHGRAAARGVVLARRLRRHRTVRRTGARVWCPARGPSARPPPNLARLPRRAGWRSRLGGRHRGARRAGPPGGHLPLPTEATLSSMCSRSRWEGCPQDQWATPAQRSPGVL
jgi:hypothetical protein